MQAINSADKHNVPLRWDQGLPMPDRRRGAINTGLEAAYTKVLRIVRRLSDLKVGPSCSLFKDWKRYRLYIKSLSTTASEFTGERKRQRGLPPNESQPEWQGNPVQRPPKGWWGNETWTAMELRKYYKTFLNEVCALYLQEAREFLTDHVSECENPKCHDKNHTLYLKDLFCGEDSLLDFSRSWDKHWTDRGAAIEKFKQLRLAGREEGRVAAPSTQQTLELAQKYAKMSPEERWAIPLHKMYPDEMEQLKQWHPKKKRKSKKSIFSMGFSELSYDEGDPVYHQEYGSGRVAADSPDDDAGVRVVFDRDLQRTVGGAGPGVMHPNKIKYIRKSSLEH